MNPAYYLRSRNLLVCCGLASAAVEPVPRAARPIKHALHFGTDPRGIVRQKERLRTGRDELASFIARWEVHAGSWGNLLTT